MNIDKLFEEIEGNLENSRAIFVKGSLTEDSESLRSIIEAKLILETLKSLALQSKELFDKFPSLEIIFEKNFGKFSHTFNRESIINICFKDEFLVPETNEFPLVSEQEVDKELLDNYALSFSDWIKEITETHEKSQQMIFQEFNLELKQSNIACHCHKCIADFRATLRDTIYKKQLEIINNAQKDLEELIVTKDIQYMSDYVARIKKNIDKNIQKVRYQLKRGSLNKLDNDVKSYFREVFGYGADLTKIYQERLQVFFNTILVEKELSVDLITKNEYERFYSQLGIGIWKSPTALQKDFEKLVRAIQAFKRKDISAGILTEYLGQFWVHSKARMKKRKIIYHMGPTNSGKTYNAIQALSKAKKGCYLAPLRLLASELFDTLNDLGCSTTLLTGEEVIEVEGATHYSSTIEMAKLDQDFECVVIDEIQMITDAQRGWAWTRALININADEVHLCGDQSVYELVEKILKLTGDELEVNNYERKTKLSVMKNQLRLIDLDKNDTLIVFSRRNALKYKRDLENLNFKVSIVYGRLSPEVRREQARKFDEGETDIMVATDAIAMGMNLPIKRIIFSATSKFFDGKEFPLTNSELKQIAGRAGRYKRFPEGFVSTLTQVDDGLNIVESALSTELKQKELAMVGPDLDIFRSVNIALEDNNLKTLSLSEFLRLFNAMTFEKPFYCVDLKEMIELAEMVEDADTMESLSDAEIFGFACAPVNQGLMEHVQYYVWMLTHYVGKKMIINEPIDSDSEDIDYLETAIKCVELYQWLARHFDNNYFSFDVDALAHNKSMAIEKLNQMLSEKISAKCSSCGCKLPDDHKFNICEKCFGERRSNRGPYRGERGTRGGQGNRKGKPSGDKKEGGDKRPGGGSGKKFDSSKAFTSKNSKKKKPKKDKASAFKKGR